MPKVKKTWQHKLAEDLDIPKVVEITGKLTATWGTGTVCIPAPREVDEVMRMVPKGSLITINMIREIVAKRHSATIG